MDYSLTDAAKAVGRTRQAIQASIKKGTISASKNAFGQWEIDPAELHRVYSPVNQSAANESKTLTSFDATKEAQIKELQGKLEVMEQLLREVKGNSEDLKQERDDWKKQADEWRMQAKALPAPEAKPDEKKRGFWLWPWSMVG